MNGSGCVFDHYGKVPEDIYETKEFASPLEECVKENDVKKFLALVEEGHDVSVKLKVGAMTCIEYCAMKGQKEMLKALLENSINAETLRQYFEMEDVVDRAYMISRNKTVFFEQEALAEANRYEAALYTAIVYNQAECLQVLLSHIGRKEPHPHLFQTSNSLEKCGVYTLACNRGHTACVDAIRKHALFEVRGQAE